MSVLKQKSAVLAKHTIFSMLTPTELDELAGQLEIIELHSETPLFSIGDQGHSMFIVISGMIRVEKTDDYGKSRDIAQIIEGDSLGEIDMISETKRTVTATADRPTEVLQFPPPGMSFKSYLDSAPRPGSKILYTLIRDIAERTRTANDSLKKDSPHIQELRRQIYEDTLTNLPNKTFLEEKLGELITSKEGPIALLMIKPDNFKLVNDNAGHEAGDRLLIEIATLLPSILPHQSLLIRFSGNEFALVLSNTNADSAKKLAEKIRLFYTTIDVSPFWNEKGFHLTVSTGIALFPTHATDGPALIEAAHRLPLLGRQRGGNCILFPEDISESTE